MTIESVKQFLETAQSDNGLRMKLTAIDVTDRSATLDAVVKLATESGFAFTAEEFLTVAHDEITRRQQAGELSDQQLEEISGGFGGDSTILLILAVILIGAGIFVKGDSTAAVKGDQLRRG